MAEDTVPDDMRNAILGALVRKPAKVEPVAEQKAVPENPPTVPTQSGKSKNFNELLSESLEKQTEITKRETERANEMRKEIVKTANFNILEGWKF